MASVQRHKSRYRVKWHVDGRAVYQSFATKSAAEDFARKVEARTVLDGRAPDIVDPNALTVARWWERWAPGRPWRPSTRESRTGHYRRYIKPVFGNVPLDVITTADVNRFHRTLERRGLAPLTVSSVHRTLSMLLQAAVDDELLARNPARTARLPRPPKTPPVALDAPTTAVFLDALDPQLRIFAEFVHVTGTRRGEAAGLTWERVDLDNLMVTIDRQINYTATGFAPTKTSETRRIPITETFAAKLRVHRMNQPVAVLDGTGFVFTQTDGRPWSRWRLTKAWVTTAEKLEKAGTPLPVGARGWHTLRHTTASKLLEAGVPVAEAAAMLGHSPEMLLRTYSHITDRAAADDRLRAALS
jgi:integrase